jgi:hypothetical protein
VRLFLRRSGTEYLSRLNSVLPNISLKRTAADRFGVDYALSRQRPLSSSVRYLDAVVGTCVNLFPFLALVVPVGVSLVLVALRRDKHAEIDGQLIYQWPRGYVYFFLAGFSSLALIVTLGPVLLPDRQGSNFTAGLPHALVYLLLGSIITVYVFRFRVVLGRSTIRSGAFFTKEITLSEIVRVEYREAMKQLVLISMQGKRIRVAETISDFKSFVRELEVRLPPQVAVPREGRLAQLVGPYAK